MSTPILEFMTDLEDEFIVTTLQNGVFTVVASDHEAYGNFFVMLDEDYHSSPSFSEEGIAVLDLPGSGWELVFPAGYVVQIQIFDGDLTQDPGEPEVPEGRPEDPRFPHNTPPVRFQPLSRPQLSLLQLSGIALPRGATGQGYQVIRR